ncbi:hypothetical protein LZD49_04750 [Dyadobacter sp. CY261]|uniref:hypothetical protein n=1 Tax=Dyadobacter sp. CY261 TaxID=2907203 RepID=UPI001F1998A4|nr:hypothetical protein [Dyadobacter sp. CY261]MCF0069769.1 hypothetical protein [Dyadobacter sp. CY261]
MTVDLRQIRIEHTVSKSLITSAFELLPDELSKDHAVTWLRELSESKDREYYDRDEYVRGDYPGFYLIIDILQRTVAENIKFYSAALFHIGRRLKVAELADSKIKEALEPENLLQTFQANEVLSNQIDQSEVIGILQTTLNEASRAHGIVATENRSLWQIWKKEIGQFRTAIQDASENLYRAVGNRYEQEYLGQAPARLMGDSFRYKELKKRMEATGFQVNVEDVSVDPENLILLQLLSMDRHELTERLELIRQENISRGLDAEALKRQREQEICVHVQNQLKSEFGDEDPFVDYRPLGKLPDSALFVLYNKCKLPDYSKFYYAERWLKTLKEPFDRYGEDDRPLYRSELTNEDVSHYAASADSAIKRSWVEYAGNSSGVPEQHLQNSFEKKWIENLIIAIRYGDKKKSKDWTFEAVTLLVSEVVIYLNGLGYKLSPPSQRRLEKLWEAAKKTYYGIEW